MSKVIATDIDGTFLDEHHKVRPDVAQLYKKIVTQDRVKVVPATGRMVYALRGALERLDADVCKMFRFYPGVYGHGAVVFGDSVNDVLHSRYLDKEVLNIILKEIYKSKDAYIAKHQTEPPLFTVTLYGLRSMTVDFVNPEFEVFAKKYEEWHEKVLDKKFTECEEAMDAFNISVTLSSELSDELYHRFLFDEILAAKLAEHRVRILRPITEQIHFMNQDEHKGKGLEILCKKYGWRREDVVAIGDSYNDLEMLQWAGRGIAMGNAVDEVKTIADEVTLPNSEGGWVAAVSKHSGIQS